jgi:DNA-binding PadR family transcriptional regulator
MNEAKSQNNRRAKYYALTRAGNMQLDEEVREWERLGSFMSRLLNATE